MEKTIAQFKLEDGTPFLVEVEEPQGSGIQRVTSVNTGKLVYQATMTLEDALEQVKPVASQVLSRLKTGLTTPADEIEVKFGLKLSVEAGAIISSVGGEVTFEVKLKWNCENSASSPQAPQIAPSQPIS
jgi:Trypsin-co-occurring domain 1